MNKNKKLILEEIAKEKTKALGRSIIEKKEAWIKNEKTISRHRNCSQ